MTAATNLEILRRFKITHIVNASNNTVPNAFPDDFTYINVNVEDDDEDDISPHFDAFHEFLNLSTEVSSVRAKQMNSVEK